MFQKIELEASVLTQVGKMAESLDLKGELETWPIAA